MAHSNTAHLGGWRALAVQIGLLVVGVFSILVLFSFGGQVIVAPALLPAQWLIARDASGWPSRAFSVLGALLVLEWVLMVLALFFREATVTVAIGVPLALIASFAFYRTSRRASGVK